MNDENAGWNDILTSNDRFWPLRSSAVGASAGAASVFTSSDIFIRFFGIGFELTNFRRRSLNWKDFDLSAKEPILIRLAAEFLLRFSNWPAIFCNIWSEITLIISLIWTNIQFILQDYWKMIKQVQKFND